MYFRYKAIKDNKVVTGRVDAETDTEAVALLKRSDYLPIHVNKQETFLDSIKNAFVDKVRFNDVVDMTRQIAIMLNAGLTLIDSYSILKKQTTKPAILSMIDTIERTLREGKNLSDALRIYPNQFSHLYISLVKAGEASGKLGEIFLKLADDLEKQREFRSKIRSTLAYPAFIIIIVIIVMFIMMTFVIPQLLGLFQSFQVDLPIQTKILIAVSSFFAHFWPFIILVTLLGVFFLRNYFSTPIGKQIFDSSVLKIPVIGDVLRMSVLVYSTRTLSVLISAGVSMLESITIITQTTTNTIYQAAFKNVYKQVEKGVTLGQALKNEEIFPPMFIQMALVGEQTGHLDETLMRVSKYFESESDIVVKTLTTFIEPAILIFLGLGVGFLVYSIITPIYTLTTSIK